MGKEVISHSGEHPHSEEEEADKERLIYFCEVPIVIEANNPHLTLLLGLEELKLEAAVNQGWMLEFTMDKIPTVVKIVDLHSLNRNHLYKVRV
jgi:hypothetical protein